MRRIDFGAIVASEPEPLAQYLARKARRDAEEIGRLKAKNQAAQVERWRRDSGLGERFSSRTFATWNEKSAHVSALEAAKKSAENCSGLWLYGPVGTGKTHLAAAIVSDCLDRGVPAVFTTGIRLLDRIRNSYDHDGSARPGERDVVSGYAVIPMLALDDLGKERFTPWTAERLYDLVNQRYEHNLPIVVTSNLAPPQLAAQWRAREMDPAIGEALVRRLIEMAGEILEVRP